jgi:hypothetical protein
LIHSLQRFHLLRARIRHAAIIARLMDVIPYIGKRRCSTLWINILEIFHLLRAKIRYAVTTASRMDIISHIRKKRCSMLWINSLQIFQHFRAKMKDTATIALPMDIILLSYRSNGIRSTQRNSSPYTPRVGRVEVGRVGDCDELLATCFHNSTEE